MSHVPHDEPITYAAWRQRRDREAAGRSAASSGEWDALMADLDASAAARAARELKEVDELLASTKTLAELADEIVEDYLRSSREQFDELGRALIARASWWWRPALRLRHRWRLRRGPGPCGWEL